MEKILFITQKRSDAIGIVDFEQQKELQKRQHPFIFFQIKEKGLSKRQIICNYFYNILLLLKITWKYGQILFSWENPYGIFIKIFYPRKKIIMTVHHVESYWGKSFIGKLIFKTTDHFIVISEFTKSQLISLGVKKDKILVNYNGISQNFYPEKLSNFQSFPYLLYVGTEIPRKNIKTLLNAFSQVIKKYPMLKLVKIGKAGTVSAQKETDFLIKTLGIEKNVILYRTFMSEEELRRWYSNAVCYISLSILEGFGLTLAEALACACPVIASAIPPFQEICRNSDVFVDPLNIKKIQKKIEIYIQQRNGKEKKTSINPSFTWENNIKNLILFFSKK